MNKFLFAALLFTWLILTSGIANQKCRPVSYTEKDESGAITFSQTFSYDTEGKLESWTDNYTDYTVFFRMVWNENKPSVYTETLAEGEVAFAHYLNYEGDLLVKIEDLQDFGSVGWYHAFAYDANGNLVSREDFEIDGTEDYLNGKISYSFDESKKTMTRTEYQNEAFQYRIESTFDTKTDPYHAIGLPEHFSKNNVVKELWYSEDGEVVYDYSFTQEFQYNTEGLPTKGIRKDIDGNQIATLEFSYDCQ